MSLPILPTRAELSPADLLRLYLRTELHWGQHLAETTPLEAGTALTNPELSEVIEANQMLEASLPEGMQPADAVNIAEAHFVSAGVQCRRWILNSSLPRDRVEPLRAYLLDHGHRSCLTDVVALALMPAVPVSGPAGVKIIPARASFRHSRSVAEQMPGAADVKQRADASGRHLDDPHYDALLALRGSEGVAKVGVLAVGEVGRIDELFVIPSARGKGIGRLLMSRALEICARSLFKHVLMGVDPEIKTKQPLYSQFGFKRIGQVESLCR